MNVSQAFEVLKLEKDASQGDIRKAYAALIKETRPEEDAEGFQALKEARDIALDYAKNPYNDDFVYEVEEEKQDFSFTSQAPQEESDIEKRLKYLLFLPNPFVKKLEWEELADEFSKLSFTETEAAENNILMQVSTFLRQSSQNNIDFKLADVAECLLPLAQLLNWLEVNTKLYHYFSGDYVDGLLSHMRSNLPLNSHQLQSLLKRNKWQFPKFSPLLLPSFNQLMKPDYFRSYYDGYKANSWNMGGSIWAFMFFPIWTIFNKLYVSLLLWAVTLLIAGNIGIGSFFIALILHFLIMIFALDALLIYDYSLKFEKFVSKLDASSKITPHMLVRRTLKLSPALNKIEPNSWLGKLTSTKVVSFLFSWKFIVIMIVLANIAKFTLKDTPPPQPPPPKPASAQSFDAKQALFFQNTNALNQMNVKMEGKEIPPYFFLTRFDFEKSKYSYIELAKEHVRHQKSKPFNVNKKDDELFRGIRYNTDMIALEYQLYESFIRKDDYDSYKIIRDMSLSFTNEAEFALRMKLFSDRQYQEAKQNLLNLNKIEQEISYYIANRASLALFLTEQGEEDFFTFLIDKVIKEGRVFYSKSEIDAAFIRAMRMQSDPLLERVLRKKRIIQ